MASDDTGSTGTQLVPAGSSVLEQVEKQLQLKLRGVKGGVRQDIVRRLQKLVEADPRAFVSNLRGLYDTRHDD